MASEQDANAIRRAAPAVAALATLALVFAVDWFTPAAVPFGPWYLIPVALAAWYLGLVPAAVMVALATVARLAVLGREFALHGPALFAVDLAITLAMHAAAAIVLLRLRRTLEQSRAASDALRAQAKQAERRLALEWSIRRAVAADVDAIVALAALGAETGDVSGEPLAPEQQQAMRAGYAAAIQRGADARLTWQQTRAVVPVEFWVSHVDGKIAGYFMMIGLDDQGGSERELHVVVTGAAHRGTGLGAAMVDFCCAHYAGRRLYATCMPDGRMHRMLARRGFGPYATTSTGYVIVARAEWVPRREQEPEAGPRFAPASQPAFAASAGAGR